MNKKQKKYIIAFFAIATLLLALFIYFKGYRSQVNNKLVVNQVNDQPLANTNEVEKEEVVAKLQIPALAPPEIPILMYHHIRDFNDPNDEIGTNLSVSPEDFKSQLDLIAQKGFNTITLRDIKENKIPEKPIILTFDDGYKNFYTDAFPKLKNKNMKAVLFIISNFVGNSEYVSDKEIREIKNYGIEIGSHTESHPDLSKSSEGRVKKELKDSKTALESLTGENIISLCYPAGKYNQSVEEIARTEGYQYATTTASGMADFNKPYKLNRYRVNKDTSIERFLK